MAASEKLSIRFEAVGAKNLQNAINAVALASDRLMLSTRKYNKALASLNMRQKASVNRMFDIQTATRNTGNAFSVLRSKMLLVSFAFLVVSKSIGRLINASAELEELMNKSNVVFGKQIGIVSEWADKLGERVGRASSEIISMATSLQDTFVPLGFTREAATQLSTSLSRLVIDVASFNNQQDPQVAKDFQSAIVGNHETVRKYGIIITESRLKLEALKIGLIKGNEQLTAQHKVLARLSLIRKGSTDAENDAINTAGSFTNQVRALNAEVLESSQFFGGWAKSIVTAGFTLGNAEISLLGITKQLARKETIIGQTVAFIALGAAMIKTNWATIKASKAFVAFGKILTKSNKVFAVAYIGITALVTLLQTWIKGTDEQAESVESLEETMRKAADSAGLMQEGEEGFSKSVMESIAKLERKINVLKATTDEEKYQAEQKHKLTEAEHALLDELRQVNKQYHIRNNAIKELTKIDQRNLRLTLKAKRKNLLDMQKEQKALKARNEHTRDQVKESENVIKSANKEAVSIAKSIIANGNFMLSEEEKSKKISDLTIENMANRDEETTATLEAHQKTLISNRELLKEQADDLEVGKANISNKRKEINDILGNIFDKTAFGTIADAFGGELMKVSEEFTVLESLAVSFTDSWLNMSAEMAFAWRDFTNEFVTQVTRMVVAKSQSNIDMAKSDAKAEIARESQTRKWQKASAKQREQLEKEIEEKHNERIKEEFELQKKANVASVTMDFAAAVMKLYKSEGVVMAPLLYGILSTVYLAQLDMINSAKPPVMKYGGLIGGRPHSQGGTMIEAERGEFIVNKSAVDAIGIETLNRINEGTSGGSINISFQGNVLSRDFIEDEAIPQIKEAIRRGADIGIG